MTVSDGSPPTGGAVGNDDSALAAAILRISTSLDLPTVLREVIESARSLTGARLGVIAAVDEAGVPAEFHFSGFAPKEEDKLIAWPDSVQVYEHLRALPGPLRLADLAAYVRNLDLVPPAAFYRTFQGTPMRHHGVDAGNFFLADKAGGVEFTEADEKILSLFAAQAAAAIANARAHRAERRTRADLEALVETSPVGVVLLDADSGLPLAINREARRIVESLRMPGQPAEQLLNVVTCRRTDGRETSLAEFPLAHQLASAETVRAEEVVLSVPDGRSVRVLINATPIPAEDGGAGSMVVTLQDLAPLDEIERMRTDFLGLVSHELRTPLTAIKGSATTLLDEAEKLDPSEARAFARIIVDQADHMRGLVADLLDAGRIDSGTLSVSPEPADVGELVERARASFSGAGGRHPVAVDLPAGLPLVLADRRRIPQVLNNLIANAARQAPESSAISIAAERNGAHVAVSVADEGPGVDPALLPHLFRKHGGGASSMPTQGLGLAICKGLVEAHGGRIWADSPGPGKGTTISFTIPAADRRPEDTAFAGEYGIPKGSEATRILVVDVDTRALRFARNALAAAGYAPIITAAAEDLPRIIRAERPRLVLLDVMLSGIDGIDLMRQMPELADLPVVFVASYGSDEAIARAFEAGAADYIVKPFSSAELVARVRAALRRRDEPETFVHGDLAIDYERRATTIGGRPVDLTPTEYDLLRTLSLESGRVVDYETLLRRVWSGRSNSNVVRVYIKSLRDKLGDDPADPTWIFNVRGVGYRMPRPGDS